MMYHEMYVFRCTKHRSVKYIFSKTKITSKKKKNKNKQKEKSKFTICRKFPHFLRIYKKLTSHSSRVDKCIVKINLKHQEKQNIVAIYLRQGTLNEMYDNKNIKLCKVSEKELHCRCFPVNFNKVFTAAVLLKTFRQLLLLSKTPFLFSDVLNNPKRTFDITIQ